MTREQIEELKKALGTDRQIATNTGRSVKKVKDELDPALADVLIAYLQAKKRNASGAQQ
jgi:hypothetical protein